MRRFRSEPWLAALLALAALSFAYRVGKIAYKGPFHDYRVMLRGTQALHHDLPLHDVEGMSREPFAAYYKSADRSGELEAIQMAPRQLRADRTHRSLLSDLRRAGFAAERDRTRRPRGVSRDKARAATI